MNESKNRVSFFWPIVLIGAGVALLLRNLGLIPAFDLNQLLRLWPLVLVVIGLDLIFGRKAPWVGGLIALLALGAVIAYLYFSPALGIEPSAGLKTETFSTPLEQTQHAEYHINGSASQVMLNASASSDDLVDATFTYQGVLNYEVLGEKEKTIRISEAIPSESWLLFDFDFSPRVWDISLNPEVPSSLYFDGGSGKIDIDLTGLNLDKLQADFGSGAADLVLPVSPTTYATSINSGSGAVEVVLPGSTSLDLTLDSGSGSITINLPAGAGVQIEVLDDGSGTVQVPDSLKATFQSDDSDYQSWQSAGYDTAAHKISIRVIGRGSGSIRFK